MLSFVKLTPLTVDRLFPQRAMLFVKLAPLLLPFLLPVPVQALALNPSPGINPPAPRAIQPNLLADASTNSPEENFRAGNVTRAIQQWSKDIKDGKNVTGNLYNRAQAYILIKQYNFALKDINEIIQREGQNTRPEIFIIQGIALGELNQLPQALNSFNQAEKINPTALVYSNRALIYQRLGKLNEALADLSQAVKLSPTPINQLNLANLRLQLSQFEAVISEMTKLIQQNKAFFPAYLTRGIAYYNLGRYEDAIKDFLFGLAITPDQPENYYYAGLSFEKLKQKKDALHNLTIAADLYLKQNQADNYQKVIDKMNELNLQ